MISTYLLGGVLDRWMEDLGGCIKAGVGVPWTPDGRYSSDGHSQSMGETILWPYSSYSFLSPFFLVPISWRRRGSERVRGNKPRLAQCKQWLFSHLRIVYS